MDVSDATLQLAGELQRCGNVVSTLRGAILVMDMSQPDAWQDLVVSLRGSDDFKDLRLGEDDGEFAFVGVRFRIARDGIVAYIEATK